MEIGKSLSFSVFCSLDVLVKTLQDSIGESVNSSVSESINLLIWGMAREKLTVSVRASIIWR